MATITELLTQIAELTNTQNSTTSSYPTTSKTRDINMALNNYFILANQVAGNWRPADDTNHTTDYPVILGDLVSGQQDYSFITDANGNQVLDIYRVRILNPDGVNYTTLSQIDKTEMTDNDLNTVPTSTPSRYYLTANGIFLVEKPNYNMTSGLEVSIARSPNYFSAGDVSTGTKKAGIPWVFHEYLALRPAYFYCLEKGLPQFTAYRLTLYGADLKSGMEGAIKNYYSNRNRAVKKRLTVRQENNH